MAFSIESRLPFLDPRLVEFTFSLPVNFRIRQGWTKWILRESLKDVLPGEIAWRRSKLGFPTPEIRWLAAGAGFIRRLLDPRKSPYVRRFVHADVLRQLQTLPDFAIASLPGIWRLINLELWFQVYFERTGRRMAVDPDHLTSVAI
jgi:asparagine synthase (glutamine-hydrolysing)